MKDISRRRLPGAIALVMALAAAACDEPAETGVEPDFARVEQGWERSSFDVYTQNVYLGGNTGSLFDPDVIADPVALLTAVNTFWAEVQISDVAGRMSEIAEEIAAQDPEVVGLQEVLQFVTLGPDFQPDGSGYIDFLAAFEQAIADQGLPYVKAVEQAGTSSALPLGIDFGTGQVTQYLGFTDRVVIFTRTDVDVSGSDSGTYAYYVPVAPNVDIKRAWARVTTSHEGVTHNFVTTHLESQRVRPVNEAQGMELIAMTTALDGVTIVTGDLNSDAAGMEGDASYTETYGNLIGAGFADVWDLAPHSRTDPGYTCCQADDLRNVTSELDERIDFVLVRSTAGPIPGDDLRRGHFRLDVVGDRPSDMTAGGLWPSDHAGLAGSIRRADAIADD